MAGVAAAIPKFQFSNSAGAPLANGTVDVYLAGTTTRTPSYQDSALTVANANPIALDSGGYCTIWLDSTLTYKLVAKNSAGATVWTEDNVTGAGNSLAAFTFTQAGTGAVARTGQDKMRESISVFDFMTAAQIADVQARTALLDLTAPIALAMTAAADIGVRGGVLLFPPGSYRCQLNIVGTINNSLGEYGLLISGYGATLVGRAADSIIIRGNTAIVGTDPAPGSNAYANGLAIEGLTLDMTAMANAATTYGIAIQRAYNSSMRDIHVIGEPSLGGGLYLGNNTYTWTIENLNCARVKIHGYNNSTNMSSTIDFLTLVANQVVVDNAFSINFVAPVIQGALDHFVLSNCQAISVFGGDLEGTGGVVYAFGTGVRAVTSIGNSVGGYTHDTYSSGVAANSNLADRPPLSGQSIGTYGRVFGSGRVAIANTSPNNIYKFTDSATGQGGGLFMVAGDDGSNGFADIVLVAFQAVVVVSSNTQYGAPPVRTYSYLSNALRVALAAVAANNVKCVALEYLA